MLALETERWREGVELWGKKGLGRRIFSGWSAGAGRAILLTLSSVRRFELMSRSNDQAQGTVE
jgi:hypothetical protein